MSCRSAVPIARLAALSPEFSVLTKLPPWQRNFAAPYRTEP